MYKLRIYKKSGRDKRNLDHEELFNVVKNYSLSPTVWRFVYDRWKRLGDIKNESEDMV